MHWGRISTAITAMGAAAWTAGSNWSGEVPYEPILFFFGAFCSWMGLEVASYVKERHFEKEKQCPTPNDLRLGRRLREAFPEQTRRFLREHEFGAVFHDSKIKPLDDISYVWKGSEYEFEDPELHRLASETVEDVNELLIKIATYCGVAGRYPPGNFSIPTDQERSDDEFQPHTREHIRELDDLATQLIETFEGFERLFRSKAPKEFG